jgi:hypothetical protein
VPLYTAGQKVRAAELNQLPQTYYTTADVTVNNSTTLTTLTGLSFAAAANGEYFIDAKLCYHAKKADGAGDIKFGWTAPSGTTGWWGALGLDTSASADTGVGSLKARARTDIGTNIFAAGGDETYPILINIFGYIAIDVTSGTVQLTFAQNAAVVHDTFVRKGGTMAVTQLA